MAGQEMAGQEMAGQEMAGQEMAGQEMAGHDHHMGSVAGLAMAGRAPDRDGLKLDVLHVPLGPVLPYWPAGLRLTLTVQGDVVQDATVEAVGAVGADVSFWDRPLLEALAGGTVMVADVARRRLAAHLDSMMRLLAVAGFDGPSLRYAVLRDRVLAGQSANEIGGPARKLGQRVERSRALRRMTEGLGELDGASCNRAGVTGPAAIAAGDAWARLVQWVRAIEADVLRLDDRSPVVDVEGPRGRLDRSDPPSAALLRALSELVVGAELAAVRLVVASLDPDIAELSLSPVVTGHG
jgi:hypothetical protein